MRLVLFYFFFTQFLSAQLPETDIFLSKITSTNGKYNFSKPENITMRKGYDNQPCFSTDNKSVLFIAVHDTSQSDIYSYNLTSKKTSQLTHTSESEYSPAYDPELKNLSVVRVDRDSAQRFYTLPLNDLSKANVIPGTDAIGYACWIDVNTIAMFILGQSHSLQLLNKRTGERKLIASDIGRCMKMSPDKKFMYFVIKNNPDEWNIYKMNCSNHTISPVIKTLSNSEDFAILPDGSLLMGKDGKLFQTDMKNNWLQVADFQKYLPSFYRLSLNHDGTLLALVGYTGIKP
jgi:tricorn protease-like protein